MRDRSVKKRWRRSLLLFGAPVVIAFVVLAMLHLTRDSEFERRVKELSRAGFPVSLDDLEKRSVPKEGVENAADVYIRAFEVYVEPDENEKPFLPMRGSYERTDDFEELPNEVMGAIASSLEKNHLTLELLHKAAQMDYCLFPKTHIAPGSLMTDYLSEQKAMTQLLAERNLYLAKKKQVDLLFESMRASIGQSRCFTKQPLLIDCLVTWAIQAVVAASLEDCLNHVAFSDEQLSILQREFSRMQEPDILSPALVNERAHTIGFFMLSGSEQAQAWTAGGLEGTMFHLYSISSVKKRDAVLLLDYYADMIEACDVPPANRLEHLMKVDDDYNSYSALHWLLHVNVHADKIWQIAARVEGGLSCAETALAIERYRLKYDGLPDSLEALVPEFLDESPLDPFDGETIRYRKLEEEHRYTLYSIGEDGVDNGGLDRKQMAEKTGEKRPESYDWPFTVQRRTD